MQKTGIKQDIMAITMMALLITALVSGIAWSQSHKHDHDDHKPEAHKDEHKHDHQEAKPATSGSKAAVEPGQVRLDEEAVRQAGIDVVVLGSAPFQESLLLTGELALNEEKTARVSSRINGRVMKIMADYGKSVAKGEVLASIDSLELGQAQSAYLQAAANYRVAKTVSDRARLLWQEKAISQAEFQERQAKFEAIQAEMHFAKNRLHLMGLGETNPKKNTLDSTFPLRSPLAGRVVDRKVTPSQMIAANDELFIVADTSSLWCYVQIFEKDLSRIKVGNIVNIKVDAYPAEKFSGVIDYIADTLDTAKRTARGRVRITNPEGRLKAGMFATLTVGTGQRDSLLVPESAILTTNGENFVFVEMAPGLYQKHCIKTGKKANGQVEILAGVEQGEKVVAKGGFSLKSELEKGAFQGCSGGPGHAH